LAALLTNDDPLPSSLKLLVCWDNEEIGSQTAQGAASPIVANTLERIVLASGGDRESFLALLPSSLCLSLDVSHAWHPGYSDRYEPEHKPLLGEGVVLKINANQRYASEAETCAEVIHLGKKSKVPIQKVINRGNVAGGSTIGPHFATATTIPTVDIGIPLLSMHSIRELIHLDDQHSLYKILDQFLTG
jgi:aspartyl aminopeptidase